MSSVAGLQRQKGDPDMATKDKARDKAQELKGSAKETIGRTKGDRKMEAEGKADKAKGATKQAGEKLKDAFK
jgi:uncharacterized protein YjbJ (UPF0337 family)